jgi:hypothetical protein
MEGRRMGLNKPGIDTKDLSFPSPRHSDVGRESPANRVERVFAEHMFDPTIDLVELHFDRRISSNVRNQ